MPTHRTRTASTERATGWPASRCRPGARRRVRPRLPARRPRRPHQNDLHNGRLDDDDRRHRRPRLLVRARPSPRPAPQRGPSSERRNSDSARSSDGQHQPQENGTVQGHEVRQDALPALTHLVSGFEHSPGSLHPRLPSRCTIWVTMLLSSSERIRPGPESSENSGSPSSDGMMAGRSGTSRSRWQSRPSTTTSWQANSLARLIDGPATVLTGQEVLATAISQL